MKITSGRLQNIEWIVVLHNTKPEIRNEIEKLLGKHENVVIKILDNDIHITRLSRAKGTDEA